MWGSHCFKQDRHVPYNRRIAPYWCWILEAAPDCWHFQCSAMFQERNLKWLERYILNSSPILPHWTIDLHRGFKHAGLVIILRQCMICAHFYIFEGCCYWGLGLPVSPDRLARRERCWVSTVSNTHPPARTFLHCVVIFPTYNSGYLLLNL